LVEIHERYLITGALDSCSFGICTQTNCHKSSYTENYDKFQSIFLQKCLLSLHTGHEEQALASFCFHNGMVNWPLYHICTTYSMYPLTHMYVQNLILVFWFLPFLIHWHYICLWHHKYAVVLSCLCS